MSEKKELEYHLVLYGDGATSNNPGPTGSGVHGYAYTDEDIITEENGLKLRDLPPLKNIPTTKGYVLSPHLPKLKVDKTVKEVVPRLYIDEIIPYDMNSTNNVGEIVASIQTVKYFIEHTDLNIKSVNYKTDSEYVIGIFKRVQNDMTRAWDDEKTKNLEFYYQIEHISKLFRELGIEFRTVKVPGHSLILGNEMSDKLAVTARLALVRGITESKLIVTEGKYWKPKVNKHPLLRVKDIYFAHHELATAGKGVYSVLDYDLEVEVGKLSSETMFGLIVLKEPDEHIEKIINYDKLINKNHSSLSSLSLSVLYGQPYQHYGLKFGDMTLTPNRAGNGINVINMKDTPLTSIMVPQGLAKTSYDRTLNLRGTMDRYREFIKSGKLVDKYSYIDITDLIFQQGPKRLEIKLPMSEKYIKFNHTTSFGKEVEMTIALGRELIDRNSLKQLEKLQPKIYVEVCEASKKCLNFNTIVDMGATGDIGVYTNFYSSTFIIKG